MVVRLNSSTWKAAEATPPSLSEKSTHIKVGGQMFLTNHALGIYTHDFSPDPTGLGVLSSITISSKEAGLGVKVIGTY